MGVPTHLHGFFDAAIVEDICHGKRIDGDGRRFGLERWHIYKSDVDSADVGM